MSNVQGIASYKKKEGIVSVSTDGSHLIWIPSNGDSTTSDISIPVESISNLQATPPTSVKVMIKVFVSTSDATTEQFVFTFTSQTDARLQADRIKESLTAAIQAYKTTISQSNNTPSNIANNSTSDEGIIIEKGNSNWTNEDLLNDMSLQQAVLSSSQNLLKTFHEAVIGGNVNPAQFWTTRLHLLRAHAVEHAQSRGSYNVLATIKPKTEDAVVRVSLSRDQIHDIFEQHPLVKRVYNEVVPKLREDEFWRRFFLSRLYKKLKGERLLPTDGYDDVLDQYLKTDVNELFRNKRNVESIPHFIDIEGNEEHHSQRKGNRPDMTMRPNRIENVPIIRTLNDLSIKLIDTVQPADYVVEATDSEAKNISNMRLQDLERDGSEEKILLRIRDQKQFFDIEVSGNSSSKIATGISKKDINSIVNTVDLEVNVAASGQLSAWLHNKSRNDHANLSEQTKENEELSNENYMTSFRSATTQISSIIRVRRTQLPSSSGLINDSSTTSLNNADGISQEIYDQLLLTHATSTEFLKHFWNAFLSGDSKRTTDIRTMVDSLRRSLDRIDAIAASAETDRLRKEDQAKLDRERRETEGKKRKKKKHEGVSVNGVELVERILAPQKKAIILAIARYQQALEADND